MFASYHLRAARPEDCAQIQSLHQDALSEGVIGGTEDRRVIEALLEESTPGIDGLIAAGRYFVLERDGMVVAGAGWAPQGSPQSSPQGSPQSSPQNSLGDTAFIRAVVVHPDHRDTVLVRTLVEVAEDAAATAGYSLFLAPVTPAIARLFEQLGYHGAGAIDVEVAAGCRLSCRKMWKYAA